MSLDRKYRRRYVPSQERYYEDSDGSADEGGSRPPVPPPPLVEQVPLGQYVTNPSGYVPISSTRMGYGIVASNYGPSVDFRLSHCYNNTPTVVFPFLCNAESKNRSGNYVKLIVRYVTAPPWTSIVMRITDPGTDYGVTVTLPAAGTWFEINFRHEKFDQLIASLPDGVNFITAYIALNNSTNTQVNTLYIQSIETYVPTTFACTYTPAESMTFSGTAPTLTNGSSGSKYISTAGSNSGVYTIQVPSPNLYINMGPVLLLSGSIRMYKLQDFVEFKNLQGWSYPTEAYTQMSYGGGESKESVTITRNGTSYGYVVGMFTYSYVPVFA